MAVFGNAGARGYYRSGYDAENLKMISSSAERTLSPGERYLLLNDVSAVSYTHLDVYKRQRERQT